MVLRAAVVVLLLVGFVGARVLYARWRRHIENDAGAVPRMPAALVNGARTWVVFTTPMCASCGPVTELLRSDGRVVTVDATTEPALADAFRIRSAPTALLADAAGEVQARLVGMAAVDGYVNKGRSASERRGLARSRTDRIG